MPKKNTKEVEQEQEQIEQDQVAETDDIRSIPCSEFDVSRLYFKAQKANKDATQLMCFPKYLFDEEHETTPENFEKHGESAIIVTGPIKMVRGGIPRYNKKYHGDDEDSMKRAYFYIPKNDQDPNSVELFDCIQKIDDYMDEEINTNENKNKVICILNTKEARVPLKGITYKRMITTAKPGSDLDLGEEEEEAPKSKNAKGGKDKKEFVPWDRIKVKFSTLYDENLGPNDKKDINTQVYVGNKATAENCKTVRDIEKHFMWNCTAQFALMFNKVWIKKNEDKGCSIGIKCVQIGVTEQPEFKARSSATKQLNRRLFATSGPLVVTPAENADEEGEEASPAKAPAKGKASAPAKAPAKADTKAPAKAPAKNAKKQEEEEPEDDDAGEDDAQEEDQEENADEDAEENESEPEDEDEDEAPKKGAKGKAPAKAPAKADVKVKAKATDKSPPKSQSGGSAKKPTAPTKKPAKK
ncbi:hypothetical protein YASMINEVIRUS_821 [Yasminevirus sp. GU-2018]|uniref:Uncharacterized protein n=1 Tax=Yasminevirus sp. GU-2018 TaxID=2420051 RepID=A0A5K0U8H8_9VIRU|nr:hypothetical protein YASMINEVIRUS_821 [Yasminevirus sp. GU-2018]